MVASKTKYLTILFLCLTSHLFAQSNTSTTEEWIITTVEELPLLVRSGEKLSSFVTRKINYKLISEISEEEIVFISCWVDTTGKTSDHSILKGVRSDLDIEALRVAMLVEFLKPAKQKGKAIRVKYIIPVRFETE